MTERPEYLNSRLPELERLRLWSRAVTLAATRISGGGSEMFIKIGDQFLADPVDCFVRIQEKIDMLNREMRRSMTEARARLATNPDSEEDVG